MLAIRMQRTGRKGHAAYRVVVQDSRQTPLSGKVVAQLGHYDPHTKALVLDKEKTEKFLNSGAQPSERVVSLLQKQGIALPAWVKVPAVQTGKIRNPEKLRKNRPEEPKEEKAQEDVQQAPKDDVEQSPEPEQQAETAKSTESDATADSDDAQQASEPEPAEDNKVADDQPPTDS